MWAQVLIVGMVGGSVQIFLLLATGVNLKPWLVGMSLNWPFGLVVLLSAGTYLLLALLEGSWPPRAREQSLPAERLER